MTSDTHPIQNPYTQPESLKKNHHSNMILLECSELLEECATIHSPTTAPNSAAIMSETLGLSEVEKSERVSISQTVRELIRRYEEYGVEELGVDPEKEVSAATGIPEKRLVDIRRTPRETNIWVKEKVLIRNANVVEKTKLTQKVKELKDAYAEIQLQVGCRHNANDRAVAAAGAAVVNSICSCLPNLQDAKVHMLYWRLKRYGKECLANAHVLSHDKREKSLHDPCDELARDLLFHALKNAESISTRAHQYVPETAEAVEEARDEGISSANPPTTENPLEQVGIDLDPRTELIAGFLIKKQGPPNPYGLPQTVRRTEYRLKDGILLAGVHPHGFGADYVWVHKDSLKEIIQPTKAILSHINAFRIDREGRIASRRVRFYAAKTEKGAAPLADLVSRGRLLLLVATIGGAVPAEMTLGVPVYRLVVPQCSPQTTETDKAATLTEPEQTTSKTTNEDQKAQPLDGESPAEEPQFFFIKRVGMTEQDAPPVCNPYPFSDVCGAAKDLLEPFNDTSSVGPVCLAMSYISCIDEMRTKGGIFSVFLSQAPLTGSYHGDYETNTDPGTALSTW
eukprot:gene7543-5322_t